jgi:hypothetical protein
MTNELDLLLAVQDDNPSARKAGLTARITSIGDALAAIDGDENDERKDHPLARAQREFRAALHPISDDALLSLLATYVTNVRMRTHADVVDLSVALRPTQRNSNVAVPGLYEFHAWKFTKVGDSFNAWSRTRDQLAIYDPNGNHIANIKHVCYIALFPSFVKQQHGAPLAALLDGIESLAAIQSVLLRPRHGAGRPALASVGARISMQLPAAALRWGSWDVYGVVIASHDNVAAVLAVRHGPTDLLLLDRPAWFGSAVVKGKPASHIWEPTTKEKGRVLGTCFVAHWDDRVALRKFDGARFTAAALAARHAIDAMLRAGGVERVKGFIEERGALLLCAAQDARVPAWQAVNDHARRAAVEAASNSGAEAGASALPDVDASIVAEVGVLAAKREAVRQDVRDKLDELAKLFAAALAEMAACGMLLMGAAGWYKN